MLLNPITFHTPTSAQEAAKLCASLEDAKLLAGGTFLLNSLKLLKHKGNKTPKHVITLKQIPELKKLSANDTELTIGSMVTIDELFESPLLKDNFSVLKTVCRNISTQPIRNVATVGGNLTCRYTWTELGSVMIALEAKLHFVDGEGREEIRDAEGFFTNSAKSNNMILTRVSVKRDKTAYLSYRRVKKCSDVDIPMLAVCVSAHFDGNHFKDSRVTVNSWTTFAKRDLVLEKFLNTASCKNGVATEALAHLDTAIYDTRSDDYKRAMFRVSLKNALQEIADRRNHDLKHK